MTVKAFSYYLSVSAIVLAWQSAAFAQTAAVGAPATPASPPAQSATSQDEIVVTADRRAQHLQDTPAAVNVVSGDSIAKLHIDSTTNLTNFVPGLKIDGNGRDQLRLGLRGAINSSTSPGNGQSVAVYIDGVYYGHGSDLGRPLFDIQQVEVLRGPQGTLYGQNVVGGLINIITKAPGQDLKIDVAGSYSSYNRLDLSGRISGPITDTLTASLSAYRTTSDGWQTNLNTGDKLDQLDTWGARARLEWHPTADLRIGLIGNYAQDHTFGIPRNVLLGNPSRYQVPTDWTKTYLVTEGGYHSHSADGALLVDYTLGGGTTLSSVTSYQTNRPTAVQNFVTDPVSDQPVTRKNNTDTFAQELRLAGSTGRLRWQTGGFYYNDDAYQTQFYNFFAAPHTRAADAAGFGPTGFRDNSLQLFRVKTKSESIFAQGTYSLTDWLNLTAGGRYSWDKKNASFTNTDGGTLIGGRVGPPYSVDRGQKSHEFTPKVTLDTTFKNVGFFDTLLFYATYSRGYQTGDFTVGTTAANSLAVVPPQLANNIEGGFKTTFLNGAATFDADVFHVDYKHLQTLSILSNGQTSIASTDAVAKGVELSSVLRPFKGFSISADYALLDTKISQGAIAPTGVAIGGNRLPQSPHNSFDVTARYEMPVGERSNLAFTLSYAYKSSVFFDVNNARTDYTAIDDHSRVKNLDGDVSLSRGRWTFSVWAKNILNTETILRAYDGSKTFVLTSAERNAGALYIDGTVAPPRSVGGTIRWSY